MMRHPEHHPHVPPTTMQRNRFVIFLFVIQMERPYRNIRMCQNAAILLNKSAKLLTATRFRSRITFFDRKLSSSLLKHKSIHLSK